MQKCFKCEGQFSPDALLEIKRGMRFCNPCHSATYFKCACCEKTKLRDENGPKTVNAAEVCEYCFYVNYKKCKSCTVAHKVSDGIVTSSNNFFCNACAVDRYFECGYCHRRNEADNLWRRTPDDGPICRNCQGAYTMEKNPPPICNYSYKPKPKWQGEAKNKLYYGVELEVDTQKGEGRMSRDDISESVKTKNDKNAKALRDAMPFIYCKSDGSVPAGFEIVTHPMDYYWILKNKDKFDALWGLVKKGYVSHDSGRCGMHIHMSKDAFTRLHLYKFMQFFQKNKALILTISQRGTEEKLNAYSAISYDRGGRHPSLASMATHKGGHDARYQAVNLQNDKTVEIRIFRGTLKKERFFKNLEFCQALYEFTMIVSAADCTMEKFLGFVSLYKREFANLHDFLAERYKWTLVKRKPRKGEAKFGVRYSGPMDKVDINADIPDADWEDTVVRKQTWAKAELTKKILMARKAKELANH